MFSFLGQPNSSEWIPVASLPRWASIPLLFCPFHRFSPSVSRLFRSHCPLLHHFHPQVRRSLFGNLVAQFVGIACPFRPGKFLPLCKRPLGMSTPNTTGSAMMSSGRSKVIRWAVECREGAVAMVINARMKKRGLRRIRLNAAAVVALRTQRIHAQWQAAA